MRLRLYGIMLGMVSLLVCNVPGFAEEGTVFVQAKTAQIRAGKTSLDAVVATVQLGEALQVLRRDGDWLEVRTGGGRKGWLFANKVSASRPETGESTAASLGKRLRQGDAAPATATAGARGLTPEVSEYAKRAGVSRQHREDVDRMSTYHLTDQEIETFLKQGRLGEYAR